MPLPAFEYPSCFYIEYMALLTFIHFIWFTCEKQNRIPFFRMHLLPWENVLQLYFDEFIAIVNSLIHCTYLVVMV